MIGKKSCKLRKKEARAASCRLFNLNSNKNMGAAEDVRWLVHDGIVMHGPMS
jgi:hypothetical protein